MQLNHLDLQVSNVHAARTFFETHFGLGCVYQRGSDIAIFRSASGFEFSVSNLRGQTSPPVYPPDFHIGFILEDASQVEATYQRFQQTGVHMKSAPREGGANLYFVCLGPDGIPIEVRGPKRP